VPAPAVPGPEDLPPIASEVPAQVQTGQDVTSAVDLPTIPEPTTGLIPGG
jgi:hypothetical protein